MTPVNANPAWAGFAGPGWIVRTKRPGGRNWAVKMSQGAGRFGKGPGGLGGHLLGLVALGGVIAVVLRGTEGATLLTRGLAFRLPIRLPMLHRMWLVRAEMRGADGR